MSIGFLYQWTSLTSIGISLLCQESQNKCSISIHFIWESHAMLVNQCMQCRGSSYFCSSVQMVSHYSKTLGSILQQWHMKWCQGTDCPFRLKEMVVLFTVSPLQQTCSPSTMFKFQMQIQMIWEWCCLHYFGHQKIWGQSHLMPTKNWWSRTASGCSNSKNQQIRW